MSMKKIAAAAFKAKCLTLMEQVRSTKQPLLITKRGKPVAKLVPVDSGEDNFIGRLKGVFRVVGDIESPVEPAEAWESAR
jgi:prevent-host-death family protein